MNRDRPDQARDAFYNRSSTPPSNAIEVPKLALPTGGGAIKGIDEKLVVNAVNGTAGFSLPLPLTQGRAMPAVSLSYDSGHGNGVFGLGWSLDTPSIARRTNKLLPRYFDADDSDTFVLSGAEDLVPALRPDGTRWETVGNGLRVTRYRPRIESGFSMIERVWRDGDPTFSWKVTSVSNTVTFYGVTSAGRLADPADARKVFRWLPELAFDDKGNVVVYQYAAEDGAPGPSALHDRNRYDAQNHPRFANTYLKRLRYCNREPWYANDPTSLYTPGIPALTFACEVVFDYGEHGTPPAASDTQTTVYETPQTPWPARADAHSDYRAGFEIRTLRLCRRVLMFHQYEELGPTPCLVRSLDLAYAPSVSGTEQLAEVTYLVGAAVRGYTRNQGSLYDFTQTPLHSFGYQPLAWQSAVQELSAADVVGAPVGLGDGYQWVDLWNEGIAGILAEHGDAWLYKRNLGNGELTAPHVVARRPSFDGLGSGLSLEDLDADGSRQLVARARGHAGYFELDPSADWQPFTPFAQQLGVDVSAPNVLHLDLDGDGRADVLVTEDEVTRWYPSEGRSGFAQAQTSPRERDEELGPALVWNDPIQRIFLADMSGDGLSDIVRIRNGEVCYWPNLGYGRFGAKVAMDNAPQFAPTEQFDPRYLHLADLSGTGASDVIYLDGPQATVWLNLAGNGWSAPLPIALPETVLADKLAVVDLLGNGTACLVWSSPLPADSYAPLRYIDLFGGHKPHLLVRYDNGTGKTIALTYRSSTQFYLDDNRGGTPWQTRLPFPVQCVARVETRERITDTLLVQEYTYHHGYYDHHEREFRGFARVDHTDTESFARWVRESASNVVDEGFHQPVVLTRSWYHTGATPPDGDLLGQFSADVWYRNAELTALAGFTPPAEPALPPVDLPVDLSPDELREAFRAYKGTLLRKEVFALDAPPNASAVQRLTSLTPFTVDVATSTLERIQPQAGNPYAVFQVAPREALTINYERAIDDARLSHTLHLALDAYGRPTTSAAVAYARQAAIPIGTPAFASAAQQALHVVVTERRFTDDDFTARPSPYRLPVECETQTFELTGVAVPSAHPLFDRATLAAAYAAAAQLGFEVAPSRLSPQKRLLEHVRVLQLADDLASPLALGKASPLGLPYASYRLALTSSLFRSLVPAAQIADADVPAALGTRGGHVHFDDHHGMTDSDWWIPSGTNSYLGAALAPKRFYQPAAYTDPRGSTTTVMYFGEDATRTNATAHWDLLASSTDAVGNTVQILAYDFRHRVATELSDLNSNLSHIVLDDLGRVVASALMGKGSEGDSLDTLIPLLADRAAHLQAVKAFFAQGDDATAAPLLANATTRWVYDDTQIPTCAASIRRERHVQDMLSSGAPLALQLAFHYTGGAGNTVLHKVRVPDNLWLGNGRTVVDNKNNPVRQFEPYFTPDHGYEPEALLVDTGVSPTLTYDSIGRHIRTDYPDGTYDHTVFDAWSQQIFDQNDTVLTSAWYAMRLALPVGDPQRAAAEQTALHDSTPLMQYFDSLGRPCCAVAHNRGEDSTGTVVETFPQISAQLDVAGHVVAISDALGHVVVAKGYDMCGRSFYQTTTDSGTRWTIFDVANGVLYTWDSRGHRVRNEYDALHRPTNEWLLAPDTTIETLFGQKQWGEAAPSAAQCNLRGMPWKIYDQAGLFLAVQHDFQGNRLESRRQYTTAYSGSVAWPAVDPDALLDPETFRTRAAYDALNRPLHLYSPDTPKIPATDVQLSYDIGGRLTTVTAALRGSSTITPFVNQIRYNEKGQRRSIAYGNGASTAYVYDPLTFRLIGLTTTVGSSTLQDLHYVYDPVANITSQVDNAQEALYFANAVATPSGAYEYDALYRLTRALGRESIGQNAPPDAWDAQRSSQLLPNDGQAMQPYDERYEYDLAGSITKMVHAASSGGAFANRWTRTYAYDPASNRLATMTVGGTTASYAYNPHGSMTAMPHLQAMAWDPAERLQYVRQGTLDAYYNYDDTGRRARKVVDKQGGIHEVRLYFGPFEIFRQYRNGALELERESQHIMDDQRRIALVDTRTVGDDGIAEQLVRYQLANHLGSAALELDGTGALISYEEYHPFGTTSWQAGRTVAEVSLKRYRYIGLERDDESGLGYHGARYYAPWLGRWVSADPAGLFDGPNVYAYSSNNPIVLRDSNGMTTGKPNETDHVIMQMTDSQLHTFLSTLEPRLQKALAAGATGAFAQRAVKMIERYNLQSVKITAKTRTIGDTAAYKDQGKANYHDILGSKRRADEAEHALSRAGGEYILEEKSSKWNRESPTIVLAEAQSRIKTPTDNQLTRDLKAGKITAAQWLSASKTNAYESWFEARAQGVTVPSAEKMADAVIKQEQKLNVRYNELMQKKLHDIQVNAAYGDAALSNVLANQPHISAPMGFRTLASGSMFVSAYGGAIVAGTIGITVASGGTDVVVAVPAATVAADAGGGTAVATAVTATGIRIAIPLIRVSPVLYRVATDPAVQQQAYELEQQAISEAQQAEPVVRRFFNY